MQGRIIKIISNRYTVLTSDKQELICYCQGKIRLQFKPCVGDFVVVEENIDQYAITKILPRKNSLIRPAIANVDQALIVMSAKDPNFSTGLVDRLSVLVCQANIEPIICVTKLDLCDLDDEVFTLIDDYINSGYQVLRCQKDQLDEDLIDVLSHKVTVLCGQSGVGKSTILNTINPEFALKTQETSKALGRGKHTTRHSELHHVAQGLVADTPGFSSLDFSNISILDVALNVKDFQPYIGECKFNDCLHLKEPNCKIKQLVDEKKISSIRYQNYLDIVKLITEGNRKRALK